MSLRTIQGILLGVVIGVAVGIGAYTFAYAKGWSYLSTTRRPAPTATSCANSTTAGSSHPPRGGDLQRLSHPGKLIGKYATKASNGFWHSFYFTTGGYGTTFKSDRNREITEHACRKCHGEIVGAIEPAHPAGRRATRCLRCHDSVGHLLRGAIPGRMFEEDLWLRPSIRCSRDRRRRRPFLDHRWRRPGARD